MRRFLVYCFDSVVVVPVWMLAHLLCLNFQLSGMPAHLGQSSLAIGLIQSVLFLAFGLYRRLWRYANSSDLKDIVFSVALSLPVLGAVLSAIGLLGEIPAGVWVIHPVLLVLTLAGARISYRAYFESKLIRKPGLSRGSIIVLGAGESSIPVLKDLERSKEWSVVGLLDDDPTKHGSLVRGCKVMGPLAMLPKVAKEHDVHHVVVAFPSASLSQKRQAVELCKSANVAILSMLTSPLKSQAPVLVVGGAGFIGSHVVDILLKEGHPVRVLDRLIYGESSFNEFLSNPNFELIQGDATDIVKLTQAMNNVSAVVHMAGLVGDPACAVDPSYTRHANVIATRMVKDTARSMGVSRFVFASSCSVYGISDDPVDETSPLNPVSLYAKTKIDSERELLSEKDLCVTVLRFATAFGHSRRPRFDLVANLFTAQAYIDGKITVAGPNQWRPFVHVRDIARAVVAVVKAPKELVSGEVFNVGDSRMNLTIGQLGEKVREIVSVKRPVEVAVNHQWTDTRNYFVSFDKIKNTLGFESETDVDAGIREMLNEFVKGTYSTYRSASYSNLEMTKVALTAFQDPQASSKLYRPVADL